MKKYTDTECKEYEIIVDAEFIKERDKVLDKQVKFLKSKGYEMGSDYYAWNKVIKKNNNEIMLCIDLSLSRESDKCYVYLADVEIKKQDDIKAVQEALYEVQLNYQEVKSIVWDKQMAQNALEKNNE